MGNQSTGVLVFVHLSSAEGRNGYTLFFRFPALAALVPVLLAVRNSSGISQGVLFLWFWMSNPYVSCLTRTGGLFVWTVSEFVSE